MEDEIPTLALDKIDNLSVNPPVLSLRFDGVAESRSALMIPEFPVTFGIRLIIALPAEGTGPIAKVASPGTTGLKVIAFAVELATNCVLVPTTKLPLSTLTTPVERMVKSDAPVEEATVKIGVVDPDIP